MDNIVDKLKYLIVNNRSKNKCYYNDSCEIYQKDNYRIDNIEKLIDLHDDLVKSCTYNKITNSTKMNCISFIDIIMMGITFNEFNKQKKKNLKKTYQKYYFANNIDNINLLIQSNTNIKYHDSLENIELDVFCGENVKSI